jgi:predicted nuclease with TOPRIM domain
MSELRNTKKFSEVKDTANNTKDMKEELDKHFNDTETFNSQDIVKLHKLLDKLKEKIEELEKNLEISNDEAKNLTKIVDDGKINLELMPKKTWFITTWNKLKNIDNNIKTILGFKDTVFNLIEYATKWLG